MGSVPKEEVTVTCKYCGRQTDTETIQVGEKAYTFAVPVCSCEREIEERHQEQLRERAVQHYLHKLEQACGPLLFQTGTFDQFQLDAENQEAFEAAQAWAKGEIPSLLLLGNTGTGKTHLAIAASREFISTYVKPVTFISVTPWLFRLRALYPSERLEPIERATQASSLVLDDLGISSIEDAALYEEVLFMVIDHRYRHGLKTLMTANFKNPAEAKKKLGERIFDRLRDSRWCRMFLIETQRSFRG